MNLIANASVFTAAAVAKQTPHAAESANPVATADPAESAQSVAYIEPTALQMTVSRLNAMEMELLSAQANKEPTPPSTLLKPVAPLPEKKPPQQAQQPLVALNASAAAGMQNSPLKYSSVLNRPVAGRGVNQRATAQASGNGKTTLPKPALAGTNSLRRSNNNSNNSNVNNNNSSIKPFFGTRFARSSAAPPPRPSSKTECYGPPNNVASRLSARSRTMLDMNGNSAATTSSSSLAPKPLTKRAGNTLLTSGKRGSVRGSGPSSGTSSSSSALRLNSREDIASSTSTLKASNEQLSSSRSTIKLDERHSEPKQLHPEANDGWLTVKNRRRSSMHWANRFNQPTGYASLPTLALLNEQKEEKDKREKAAAAAVARQAAKSNVSSAKAPKAANNKSAKTMAPTVQTRPEIKNAKAKVNSFPVQRSSINLKKQDKEKEKDKDKELEKSKDKTEKEQDKEKDNEKEKEQEKQQDKDKQLKPTARSSSNCSSHMIAPAQTSRTAQLIKRQKSDLTGLKMTSLHKEYMRSEKNALRKQQKVQKEQSGAAANDVGDGE